MKRGHKLVVTLSVTNESPEATIEVQSSQREREEKRFKNLKNHLYSQSDTAGPTRP